MAQVTELTRLRKKLHDHCRELVFDLDMERLLRRARVYTALC